MDWGVVIKSAERRRRSGKGSSPLATVVEEVEKEEQQAGDGDGDVEMQDCIDPSLLCQSQPRESLAVVDSLRSLDSSRRSRHGRNGDRRHSVLGGDRPVLRREEVPEPLRELDLEGFAPLVRVQSRGLECSG